MTIPYDTTEMDNQKRELASRYESETNKQTNQEVTMLQVKCELNINRVREEIADRGNGDTVTV